MGPRSGLPPTGHSLPPQRREPRGLFSGPRPCLSPLHQTGIGLRGTSGAGPLQVPGTPWPAVTPIPCARSPCATLLLHPLSAPRPEPSFENASQTVPPWLSLLRASSLQRRWPWPAAGPPDPPLVLLTPLSPWGQACGGGHARDRTQGRSGATKGSEDAGTGAHGGLRLATARPLDQVQPQSCSRWCTGGARAHGSLCGPPSSCGPGEVAFPVSPLTSPPVGVACACLATPRLGHAPLESAGALVRAEALRPALCFEEGRSQSGLRGRVQGSNPQRVRHSGPTGTHHPR